MGLLDSGCNSISRSSSITTPWHLHNKRLPFEFDYPTRETFLLFSRDRQRKNECKIYQFPRMQGRLAQRRERKVDIRPCITYPKFLRESNMSPTHSTPGGNVSSRDKAHWKTKISEIRSRQKRRAELEDPNPPV